MQIEWKPIPEFEGYYEISNSGLVKSLPREVSQLSRRGITYLRKVPGFIMTPVDNGIGYFQVGLTKNSQRKRKYIHVLVAEAFVEKPDYKCEVDHDDEDKSNNKYTNLKWVTRKVNMKKCHDSNPHILDNLI